MEILTPPFMPVVPRSSVSTAINVKQRTIRHTVGARFIAPLGAMNCAPTLVSWFEGGLQLLCGMMLSLALTSAHAAPSEYELKAAFIYQIARFVEWPGTPVNTGAPLQLCVLGGNPFGPALENIRGKPVGERKMEVSLLDMNAGTRECAMLFIAAPAEKYLERIIALSRGTGMLTIGDTQGFARRGVMVNFFQQDGKIRFEVNLEATRQGGLKISSKLLSLARITDSGTVDSGTMY